VPVLWAKAAGTKRAGEEVAKAAARSERREKRMR